ncbi:MAG: nucleotidyltransferase domain-containing protein, partial [Shewanella sp.]
MNIALLAKQALIEHNQTLLASFKVQIPIEALVTQRCQFVDTLVKQAWKQHGLGDHDIALIAVGGYGRGELHPHSDVDLLFLFKDMLSPAAEAALSQFIAFLWDANLEIGHSVRTLDDTITLGRADITIATNLLEARLLEGPEVLFDPLYDAIRQSDFWSSSDFFIAKRDEQHARHAKASAFDLEPNIKSCPGGLRDIQTIAWVAM